MFPGTLITRNIQVESKTVRKLMGVISPALRLLRSMPIVGHQGLLGGGDVLVAVR
ncbi:MAG: hypothetical protein HY675_19110 [Chloroflexi bacterium]|nr:hypothetical protein [Chloroflexota bacterium]